jgi:3-isopropylmalate/(R)-2-methylmalate dehydratase large subunit
MEKPIPAVAKEFVLNRERTVSAGRVLYLTQDRELIRQQLAGETRGPVPQNELLSGISTDAIIPNRVCLRYTGQQGLLGNFVLTGLPGNSVKPGEVAAGNFQTVVAGPSFARGSSRIHAPMAIAEAGIKTVVAKAERIFTDNCINAGIYALDPQSPQAQQLLAGETLSQGELIAGLSPMKQDIMRRGSLLSYLEGVEKGVIAIPEVTTSARPMTIAEKIIARKALKKDGTIGRIAVKPGDEIVAVPDHYYGYELQSGPMRQALTEHLGENVQGKHSDKVRLYADHTALLTTATAQLQRDEQSRFAHQAGFTVYDVTAQYGAPAICHTDMVENHALPGQLVLGNDSHTCTVGVLNNLAIGKGALDLAGAIAYDKMVLEVPETIRINLRGKLPYGVTMKDFMLQFGATPEMKEQQIGSGRVLEFGGDALDAIPFDEQLKLTNMSVELLGFSGVLEPNQQITSYLISQRGMTADEVEEIMVSSDEGAEYSHEFTVDLSKIDTMVSTPGDTQNGVPLATIREQRISINKAYIGSCTHGTVDDLHQAAQILQGRHVAEDVTLFVQASSLGNLQRAKEQGFIRQLSDAGAEVLNIGCGACMNAGPGSTEEGEVAIFATNRNFNGRTGLGDTYLASPSTVAASAVLGYIGSPEDLPKTKSN